MDADLETVKHITAVRGLLLRAAWALVERAHAHDESKLREPERAAFAEWTPKLAGLTYGSREYDEARAAMAPALAHHCRGNRHHPEHFAEGVDGMNLIDVLEMLCDWAAAATRHNDGDLRVSVEVNQKRFGYDDGFKRLLVNTATDLGLFGNAPKAGDPP
jgi:hypothetical protein